MSTVDDPDDFRVYHTEELKVFFWQCNVYILSLKYFHKLNNYFSKNITINLFASSADFLVVAFACELHENTVSNQSYCTSKYGQGLLFGIKILIVSIFLSLTFMAAKDRAVE